MPAFYTEEERDRCLGVRIIATTDPFSPRRITGERMAIPDEHVDGGPVWSFRPGVETQHENVARIRRFVSSLVNRQQAMLAAGHRPSDADLALYRDVVIYDLYDRHDTLFQPIIDSTSGEIVRVDFYEAYLKEYQRLLCINGLTLAAPDPLLLFAWFFQLRRAFFFIYTMLLGSSRPSGALRTSTWQANFSYRQRDYLNGMHLNMDKVTLHVTGPSGSGKELVARCIGKSRFAPYDLAASCFPSYHPIDYHALNLAELPRTLFESEMFGHERGAFTGAIARKTGWLEQSRPGGTLALDEIADLVPDLQSLMLRVIQERVFHRVGGKELIRWYGKLITITHKDLEEEVRAGRFRMDLFQRLYVDVIKTPSLCEQFADTPGERRHLVQALAAQFIGAEQAARDLDELDDLVGKSVPADYAWAGNVRELEARVKRLAIRGLPGVDPDVPTPRKGSAAQRREAADAAARSFLEAEMSSAAAGRRYTTLAFVKLGNNYEETARQLEIDRRTVIAHIDPVLFEELTGKPFEPPKPGRPKKPR